MPTVNIDGTEHTVTLDAVTYEDGIQVFKKGELEQQYVQRSMIEGEGAQYVSKAAMTDRFQNWIARDKVLEDETLVAQVIQANGEAFKTNDLEEAKRTWAAAELDPIVKEVAKSQKKLATFEQQVIASAIEAGAGKVWSDPFASAPPGKMSWAQINFRDDAQWDGTHGYVVATEMSHEGKRVPRAAVSPTPQRPYMSIEEHMALSAETDAFAPYRRPAERIKTGEGALLNGKTSDATAAPDKGNAQDVAKWWGAMSAKGMTDDEITQAFLKLPSAKTV